MNEQRTEGRKKVRLPNLAMRACVRECVPARVSGIDQDHACKRLDFS